MIKSCITISLVPEVRGGPFVLWDGLEESCRQAARIGFDAVELFVPGAASIDRQNLAQILRENNLSLAAVGTGAGFVVKKLHLCDPDAEKRRQAVEFISGVIEFAGLFGAMTIIGSMKGSIPKAAERKTAESHLRAGLDELAALAGNYNVPLLLEPLNRYETNFINRLDEAVELIQSLKNDNVKVLADLFHCNIEEKSICGALRQAGRYLGHLHFVDSNRRPAGLGHIDFAEVARTLKDIGFNGYAAAEALPWPSPIEAAEQTMKAYRKFFANL
jgi:sugar phosphate isomerase/epimerase